MNNPLLIVGLGNPGKEYQNTRHNLGFMVLEKLSGELFPLEKWSNNKSTNSLLIESICQNRRVTLAMPQTYMNLSGNSVQKILNNMPKDTELIVVHDEVDLDKGLLRVSISSSAAGHNGVRSIIHSLSSQDFTRIRIGILEDIKVPLSDFVLSKLSKEEQDDFTSIILSACDIIKEGIASEFRSQTINAYE